MAVRYGFIRDFYVILGAFDRQGKWADQGPGSPDGRVDLARRAGGPHGGGLALWPAGRRAPVTVRATAGAAIAGAGGPEPPRDRRSRGPVL